MSGCGVVVAVEALAVADIGGADSAACADLLGSVRRTRGWLDALEARITSRMTHLYQTAAAPPAASEHGRHGGVSAAEGQRREHRSKTIDDAPSFGDALSTGAIAAEHVDALANAASTAGEAIKTELLAAHEELAGKASAMTPEQSLGTAATASDRWSAIRGSSATAANAATRSCPARRTWPPA